MDKPLIICEGKTDIVYLKCALRQLEKEYGEFIQKKDNSFVFKVGFLNLSKNLKDVLAMSEGTSGLKSLMYIYKKYMKPFKGEGKKYPVIILTDNDSGSKGIKRILKDNDSTKPFSYFVENMYVAYVPSISGNAETEIEDLFDKKVLETKVAGKTFKRKGKVDQKTEYSKQIFAEKVIKANQDTINFNSFKELLDRFKEVIVDYDQKKIKLQTTVDKATTKR